MSGADEMVAWLREAIQQAEQVAQKASDLCGCHPAAPSWTFGDESTDGRIVVVDEPHPGLKRKIGRRWNGSYEGLFMAEHIAANDPASVLRRVAADRKTLDLHPPTDCGEFGCDCHHCCRTCRWTEADDAGRQLAWGEPIRHVYPCPTIRALAEGYGWTGTEDSGQHTPASSRRLSSSDPQPPTGTVVVDDSGTTWINTGDHPCPWVPYRHDGDPESWTKIAGNYGPVTIQPHGTT